MALHRYTPLDSPLADFVECLWLYEGEAPAHKKERRLPDGSVSLIINLRDDYIRIYDQRNSDQFQDHSGCIISGARSRFTLLDTANLTEVMGVEFKPGGALPFLPLPVAELHNEVVSLDMVWGMQVIDLYEQLLAARTVQRRFTILEHALCTRLLSFKPVHPAVTFALKLFQDSSYAPTGAVVAERIGLSQARFIQVFRDAVGLTPKQFCRIHRFQDVLRVVEQGTSIRWVELAVASGYFDQAHFIHDFQKFSGLTPETYLALRGVHSNHVALLD